MTTARRALGRSGSMVVMLAMFLGSWASAALANHEVSWGVASPNGPRSAEATAPTDFAVSVSFDGQPMAGWPMFARVTDANGELIDTIEFATDEQGVGEFTVSTPGGSGPWRVQVCDDDGCVYGDATLTAPVPAPPSSPPAESPAASEPDDDGTPTETATPRESTPGPTATTLDPAPATTGGSDRTWVWVGGAGGLLGLVGAGLFFAPTRTRTRTKDGDDTEPRTPRDDDDEEDVGDVGQPPVGEVLDPPAHCDWAAYFVLEESVPGTKKAGEPENRRILVRKPRGRECCSYEISIRSLATEFHDYQTAEEQLHHLGAGIFDYYEAHRIIEKVFAGESAGLRAYLRSWAEWVSEGSLKGLRWIQKGFEPTELAGALVTEIELRLHEQPHCLGNGAHKFTTESVKTSGFVLTGVGCREPKYLLPIESCDNSFKVTIPEFSVKVKATDQLAYDVQKKTDWDSKAIKGSAWKIEKKPLKVSGEIAVGKKTKATVGPVDLSAEIGGGITLGYEPADDHNPKDLRTQLEGSGRGAGTSGDYKLTFGHAVGMRVEHKHYEIDLIGKWSDYTSYVLCQVDVAHTAHVVGDVSNQWDTNHKHNPTCCKDMTAKCCCYPELQLFIRGADEDTKKIKRTRGRWKVGRTMVDALLLIDDTWVPITRRRSTTGGEVRWEIHDSWKRPWATDRPRPRDRSARTSR